MCSCMLFPHVQLNFSHIFYVIWIPPLSILRQAFHKLGDIIYPRFVDSCPDIWSNIQVMATSENIGVYIISGSTFQEKLFGAQVSGII